MAETVKIPAGWKPCAECLQPTKKVRGQDRRTHATRPELDADHTAKAL